VLYARAPCDGDVNILPRVAWDAYHSTSFVLFSVLLSQEHVSAFHSMQHLLHLHSQVSVGSSLAEYSILGGRWFVWATGGGAEAAACQPAMTSFRKAHKRLRHQVKRMSLRTQTLYQAYSDILANHQPLFSGGGSARHRAAWRGGAHRNLLADSSPDGGRSEKHPRCGCLLAARHGESG